MNHKYEKNAYHLGNRDLKASMQKDQLTLTPPLLETPKGFNFYSRGNLYNLEIDYLSSLEYFLKSPFKPFYQHQDEVQNRQFPSQEGCFSGGRF